MTDTYGWKAQDDLNGLDAAGNDTPWAIWGNATKIWVLDSHDTFVYSYNRDGNQDTDNGFDLHTDNGRPTGAWSNGATVWVSDTADDKLYAYQVSGGARQASLDLDLHADNDTPTGSWSDGTTIWVADFDDDKLYAYLLDGGTRQPDADIALPSNSRPGGIWSDGVTMWVAFHAQTTIFAYSLADGSLASRDFATLMAAGVRRPTGIWSDGRTMWIADEVENDKVYAFNMPSADATLSALTVSPRDIIGFAADRASYSVGVASTVTQVTISATPNHSGADAAITPADADADAAGHQVALSAGRNLVTVTVIAEDTTTEKTYTVNVNRGVTDPYGWKAVDDLDGLAVASNGSPTGIWSDGATMWVADYNDGEIYAYNADGSRDESKDFGTLSAAGNEQPRGIWSDGTTMWVMDYNDGEIYAYDLATKARDADLGGLAVASNGSPTGIWSDGATMWVADHSDGTIQAYNLATKARDADQDFNTLREAGNHAPQGIWSNGATMWVADTIDSKLYAYDLSTKAREAGRDFNTLAEAGNTSLAGIWSDGTTMWVVDPEGVENQGPKVYSYNMPGGIDAASFRAVEGDGRVALTWESPEADDITGYQYRVSADNGRTWSPDWTPIPGSTASTTSFTVRDLTNMIAYRIQVRYVGSNFQGAPASVEATPMGPPARPLEPVNVGTWEDGPGQLWVYWSPPPAEDPRTPVTSYTVRHQPLNSSRPWTRVEPGGRVYRPGYTHQPITGLANRTHHEVQVSAVNRVGSSGWASAVGTPQAYPEPPVQTGRADLSVGRMYAIWTDGRNSDDLHPESSSGNGLENACIGVYSFKVAWAGPENPGPEEDPRLADEYEAHFITRYGTGAVTHRFAPDEGDTNRRALYGAISVHGNAIVTIWVRGRFGDDGWGHWSPPVILSCHPTEQSAAQTAQARSEPEEENSPAQGAPVVSSVAEPGRTLGVDTSTLWDADGMENAVFAYQWVRGDGSDLSDIPGATASTYTVTGEEVGDRLQVRVSFTDDAGYEEAVTSGAVLVQALLHGSFDTSNNPSPHDGSTAFTLGVVFSEEPSLTSAAMRNHVLTVTNGQVTNAGQTTQGSSLRWTVTIEPDGDGDVSILLPWTSDCAAAGAVCTEDGRMLANGAATIVLGPDRTPEVNSPATGKPTIGGAAAVGQTLTVSTAGIADENGMEDADFAYQWVHSDGGSDHDISGATGGAYTVHNDDVGRGLRVRVSFTDDAGYEESVESEAVSVPQPAPLTGSFKDGTAPANHDGTTAFTLELHFSEEPYDLGYAAVRDHVLSAVNGDITKAARVIQDSNQRWEITVEPDGDGDVTITLPPTGDCDDQGAVCTTDGKMQSNHHTLTVPGPGSTGKSTEEPNDPPPVNSPATGKPTISGAPAAGQTLTASTSSIEDANGLTGVSYSYQWLRTSGATTTSISGATTNAYVVTSDDQGKSLSVQMVFTDDDGFDESLTSDAVSVPVPLTGEIPAAHLPASHDGSNKFTFRIAFSESPALSYVNVRDHVLDVTNGDVTHVRRVTQGSDQRWSITIEPDGNADVTIVLPVTTDCTTASAVCTTDGRKLSHRSTATVAGPGS